MRLRDFTIMMLVGVPVLCAGPASAQDRTPDGKVELSTTSFALGIGGSGGDGILTLNDGTTYPFSVSEFDVGSVGLTKVTATGEVYGLEDISQFPGVYSAASADIAVGGGAGATILQNDQGVIMRLHSTQQGVGLAASLGGVQVKLHQP